jgi:hypothetical protein
VLTRIALDVLAVASASFGLIRLRRARPVARLCRSWRGEPGLWLAVVVAVCLLNQVLFSAYVIRVHGGDPTFIAHYLPPGWFAISHDPVTVAVARHFPYPQLLAPSVLRVQSAFEQAFGVLAYLTVARWYDGELYRDLLRPARLWAACVAYTAAFGIIELRFWNPYTADDLVIRGVACVLTALLIGRLRSIDGRRDATVRSIPSFAAFLASAVAFGGLVLVTYDTVLLYNLGRLGTDAPVALACGATLIVARAVASRDPGRAAGPYVQLVLNGLGAVLAAFFVCALPIRYELGFGTAELAAALGLAVAVAGLIRVVGVPLPRRAIALITAILAALAAAVVGLIPPFAYREANILLASGLALTAAVAVLWLFDRRLEPGSASGLSRTTDG